MKQNFTLQNIIVVIIISIINLFLLPLLFMWTYQLGVMPLMQCMGIEILELSYKHFFLIAPIIGIFRQYKIIKQEENTIENHVALFMTSIINRFTAILILYIINLIIF